MRLPWVAVALQDGATAECGERRGQTATFPIQAGDHHFGSLAVATRSDVEDLTPGERRLLTDLARDLATMLNAGRLTKDLQRARNELVQTREEERRRIRNDLHDGLGPQLAGIGLQLDITRSHFATDSSEALVTLARAKSALGEAIDDIRRLVDGLRPPALDEVGLLSALHQQITVLDGDGEDHMAIDLRGPERLDRLPAAVEVAAFRIVTEAVNNAVRHSGARHCTVSLTLRGGLVVEVRDDGCGMGAASPGIGLASMRQRAEELGGSVQVETGAFGTVVTASLPLERAEVPL
jgi:signal transduction histidine kinase